MFEENVSTKPQLYLNQVALPDLFMIMIIWHQRTFAMPLGKDSNSNITRSSSWLSGIIRGSAFSYDVEYYTEPMGCSRRRRDNEIYTHAYDLGLKPDACKDSNMQITAQ